jgi:hypothetical protein
VANDAQAIERLLRHIDRHNTRRWTKGIIPLLIGIGLICATFWVLADVRAQKSYIRLISKVEQPPEQLDYVMQRKAYRIGFATGALLGIDFMLGIGLVFSGMVGLRRRPTQYEALLLKLWGRQPAAT